MKRFFTSALLMAVLSLSVSVIWPNQAIAAMPTLASLGELRAQGLDVPGAMAVDGAGNLYVADARGGEVFKFDRYGRLKATFNAQATGGGLALSLDGSTLYVAGMSNVAVVNAASGEHLRDLASAGSFKLVGEVSVDGAGNVYVADIDVAEQTISIFAADGRALGKFGGAGSGSGKFSKIASMAFDSKGQLVVVDESAVNNKVQVFTIDPVSFAATVAGSYPTTSSANFGVPGIVGPRGIAFDSLGRGYFLDYSNSQVRIVSPEMVYLGSYGQAGSGVGQLAYIVDVVVETSVVDGQSNSRLFVSCDPARIEIFGIDNGVSPVYSNHAPSTPVPLSPVAGSEVTTATPTLQFAAATDDDGDALTYQVSVYQGETLLARINTEATAVTLGAGLLAENTTCSWTVEAFDAKGAGSGASSLTTFDVNATDEPPSVPVPVAPATGSSIDGAGLLVWQASMDPDPNDTLLGYQVEIAADAGFASPLLSAQVAGTEIALADFAAYADLADGQTYFWRVTATDNDGLTSVPGALGIFVYDTASLKVSANISGASVYLGGNHAFAGRYVGMAPVELRDLAPGVFSVVVERAGFEPHVTQIVVAGTDNALVYAALVPAREPAAFKLVTSGINGRSGLAVNGSAVPFLVDFDNNGQLDLLVGDATGQLVLFQATAQTFSGQLSFQPAKSLGLPVLPGASPFAADWDNDGRKDLLVGLADGSVKLFLNVGQEAVPAFGAGQDLTVAGSALNVGGQAVPVVVDLDGNGSKDLVVGNAAGQVLAFMNQGNDAAPQLASPVLLAQVAGAAVPASVDWDADGQRDLLVTVNGACIVLRNDMVVTGTFVTGATVPVAKACAVFPLELNGAKGKDLLVGQANGSLVFWAGNSNTLTAAGLAGLLTKVDEVSELVAENAPELLGEMTKLRTQVEAGSLGGASKSADTLAQLLPAGAARDAMLELGDMCQAKSVI